MQQYRKNLGKISLTAEGVWNNSKQYEILSIVYDEHTQHGFISKKKVPSGVDLYNAEYWMPLNVSGFADNNMIILSKKISDTSIQSYTLEEAIKSIPSIGRKPGAILGFYNLNNDRLDIGGRWELWQFNSTTISEWENVESWQNIYYNYNKFVGWYNNYDSLKQYNPFPEIGCYAFVGTKLNEATVYRCENKYVWINTTQHSWDYVKVIIDGNVTIGKNGNWFNNGVDTNIPASVKGENGKTPVFRNNNNIIEVSYDNVEWNPISDEIAAWFRWQREAGQQANSTGKIQITRDGLTWTDLSGEFINNLYISRYIGADESLPTSGIAEGTIYAKGPTYANEDTNHNNPIYRLWVYAWKDNTLAWQDNGEFQSIAAGIVQETGDSEIVVMSQKAVTEKLSELGSYTENPEYARVYTDAEGRFLWGIKQDGSIEFAKGVPTPIKNYIAESIINRIDNAIVPEIENLKDAHEQYLKESESPEWARVIVDADGKVLWGIRQDGSVEFTKGIPTSVRKYVESLDLVNKEEIERINQLVIGLTDTFHYEPNLEGHIEMTLDAEGRILSYRGKDGVKHEKVLAVGEMTFEDNIIFKGQSLHSLESALRNSGFTGGTGDWSDKDSLEIPTPRCAVVNVSGVDSMPTSKTQDLKAYFEMWDMQGNYFKKKVILNAQGSSSMAMPKKNFATDFCNDDWIGDDTFSLRIGDWVAQDSFHFKAYYTDFFRGSCVVGYQIADLIARSRGILSDRVWKKALIDIDAIQPSSKGEQIDDLSLQIDNGARGFPDGFPCIVYLNGEFYGVFSWQLKKHRDNYHQDKKNVKHIHLDGVLGYDEIWGANGDSGKISWTSFEVRNPKSLIDVNGGKYDGDNPKELIGEDSENYDPSNKDNSNSSKVKEYIKILSTYIPTLHVMRNNGSTNDAIRAKIEEFFDVESMIDYIILCAMTRDGDGFKKNWQWTTYNGVKWFVNPYDMDGVFGAYHLGNWISEPSGSILGTSLDIPSGWIYNYYKSELKNRWNELKSIVNADRIIELYQSWVSRIGEDNFALEYNKWAESPCNRETNLNEEYWDCNRTYVSVSWKTNTNYSKGNIVRVDFRVFESLVDSNKGKSPTSHSDSWKELTYSDSKGYNVGDAVYYGLQTYPYKFTCKKDCVGIKPMDDVYNLYPKELGYKDSIWRVSKTIKEVFRLLDNTFNNIV